MAKLISAFGYQGDAMNLPVADVEAALPFYLEKMGFSLVEQTHEPVKKAVLERDGIQFAIAENGGDPEQDGCAFHTDDIRALRDEFRANGYNAGEIKPETRDDGSKFNVFRHRPRRSLLLVRPAGIGSVGASALHRFCKHFGIRSDTTERFIAPEIRDGALPLKLSDAVTITRERPEEGQRPFSARRNNDKRSVHLVPTVVESGARARSL